MQKLTKIEQNELKILLKHWFKAAKWTEKHFLARNSIASFLVEKLQLNQRYKRPTFLRDGVIIKSRDYYEKFGFKIPEIPKELTKEEEEKVLHLLRKWFEWADFYKKGFVRNPVLIIIKNEMKILGRWKDCPRGNPRKGRMVGNETKVKNGDPVF